MLRYKTELAWFSRLVRHLHSSIIQLTLNYLNLSINQNITAAEYIYM